jgi:hypothetical protein
VDGRLFQDDVETETMTRLTRWGIGWGSLVAAMALALTVGPHAQATQTIKERSNEVRFQLDFLVSAAALGAVMPKGFTSDVATSGPAKDCNLRIIFIDRVTINGPDNNPVGKGTSQFVYLVAPVKDPSGKSSQLVIGGLTADAADAPGPYGNYLLATTATMKRSIETPAGGKGPLLETQDWVFRAASGEHLELHIQHERGGSNFRPEYERTFYSAKDPSLVRVSHEQLVLDILRNVTTNPPDRVKAFKFTGGGGSFAKLLDGTEKVLSWDNVLWINRTE